MDYFNGIVTKRMWVATVVGVVFKCFGFWVKSVQPATICASPNWARAVLVDWKNGIIAKTVRVLGVVNEMFKRFSYRVKFVQSSTERADPKRAFTVFT